MGLCSAVAGNIIRVLVGQKRKCYSVHADLLNQHRWFADDIDQSPNSPQSTQNDFYFDYINPAVFDLFINWLYRKDLPPINLVNDEVAMQQASNYLSLYLCAGDWEIPKLQNLAIDRLRQRPTYEHGWFPSDLINRIYEETSSGSPLRIYAVDAFVFTSSRWKTEERLTEQMYADNHEFVTDCYKALVTAAIKRSGIQDPNRKDRCAYHVHEEGEKCE